MKLPCVINLERHGALTFVNNAIKIYGKSQDVNNLARTIFCEDEAGTKFEIVQFFNNKQMVHFLSGVI